MKDNKNTDLMKKTIIPVTVFITVVCLIIVILLIYSHGANRKKYEGIGEQSQEEINLEEVLSMNAGVTSEKLLASYWIDLSKEKGRDVTSVDIDESDIFRINDCNRRMIVSGKVAMAQIEIGNTFNGDVAKNFIRDTYSQSDDLLNLDAIPWGIEAKFGFSISSTVLKKIPSDESSLSDESGLYFDDYVQSELDAFSPIVIIHESADGEWYYVFNQVCGGWVRREMIAVCKSREEWIDRQSFDKFIVVTGRELKVSEDPYFEEMAGVLLPMGTKLELVEAGDYSLMNEDYHHRVPYGNYIVKVPGRSSEGLTEDRYIYIPYSEDVSEGYIDFTEENIAKQAFKYQGDLYGWAGNFHANDCSGMVRRVFACFGLNLPRGAEMQSDISEVRHIDVSRKSSEAKEKLLAEMKIGTLLYFPGHIMIYLGTVNNVPYCISSVGSISSTGLNVGTTIDVNTVIVSNMLETTRQSGASWLDSLEKITVWSEE